MTVELLRSEPVAGATVSGRASIDTSTNDNGYLRIARDTNPQAGRHGNAQQAISNINGGERTKVLIGHGYRGLIVTGTGQSASDPARYISLTNQANWQPAVAALKGQCSILYLYACHPGVSQEGANFLFNLAQVLGCTVMGPTGFIYINPQGMFSLEPRSVWQSATPTHRPNPIEAPTPYFRELLEEIFVVVDTGVVGMKIEDVVSLTFTPLMRNPENRSPSLTIRGADSQEVLKRLALTEPFRLPGIPGAVVTGRLQIQAGDGTEKQFLVLNERMLQDQDNPEIFHYWSKEAASILLNAM